MGWNKEGFAAWLESGGQIPFDIYAQDQADWIWLSDIIPELVVSSAGGAVPFEAEGLLHGFPFYYREEHGYAELRVGEADGGMPVPWRSLYSAKLQYAENESRSLGMEAFGRFMMKLVPDLAVAPFMWIFPSYEVKFANDGQGTYEVLDTLSDRGHSGYGFTVEEAWANAFKTIPGIELYNPIFTEEFQLKLKRDTMAGNEPLNEDDRIFPAQMPDFRVNMPS